MNTRRPIPFSPAELREIFEYNVEVGCLCWRVSRGKAKAGRVAGSISVKDNYIHINILGHVYKAHRLIWVLVYGEQPPKYIDHRDGDRANNRLGNLRVATSSQNRQNASKRSDNRSGTTGVTWRPQSRKWVAFIGVDGRNKWLGSFRSQEEALAAYQAAARQRFGEFARVA